MSEQLTLIEDEETLDFLLELVWLEEKKMSDAIERMYEQRLEE